MGRFHGTCLGLVVAIFGGAFVACSSSGTVAGDGASDAGIAPTDEASAPVDDAGSAPDAQTATCTAVPIRPGTVGTTSGAVTGTKTGSTWAWKGIPYASPPVGALRWQPPAPVVCNAGERAASNYGPMCPQLDDSGKVVGNEDCLTLNVWAPEGATGAPVLFFMHGGGNTQGSASDAVYDGSALATRTGSVVVTIEYRLGALGFLANTALDKESPNKVSGNYGILDQTAALAWVHANVTAFGGAPTKVLLFGESAGAQDTLVHVASPLSKGLFAAAAVESGGVYTVTLAQGETAMQPVIDTVGCTAASDVLACMRGKSVESLVTIPSALGPLDKTGFRYTPVIDGYVLKGSAFEVISAGEHNHVPLILGTNADETSKMVPKVTTEADYEAAVQAQYGSLAPQLLQQYPASAYPSPRMALVRLTTDGTWTCPIRRLARIAAQKQTEPVFRYHFSWAAPGTGGAQLGAFHGIELPFVFATFSAFNGYKPAPADTQLSDAMEKYWTALAASGDANGGGAGTVAWPRYDAATDPYLELNTTISAKAGLSTANCDFVDSLAH